MNSKNQELLLSAAQALRSGDLGVAKQLLLRALETTPQSIGAKELLAYVHGRQGDRDGAQQLLKEVVNDINAPLSALYEYASLLLISSPEESIGPLERALRIDPHSFEVLHDLATAYACVGRKKEAIEKYGMAAQVNPHSSDLFYNLGCLHDELRDCEKANACYRKSIELNSQCVKALINLGLNLNQAGNLSEGVYLLERALKIEPNADFIFGNLLHAKMQLGIWQNHASDLSAIIDGVLEERRIIHPFHLLSLVDDPNLQRKASEIYANSRRSVKQNFEKSITNKSLKIKVGYFSADFHNHPVTRLTAELFELHDPNQFEIYAFSSGIKDDDLMRRRLKAAFHEFIDITHLSDDEAVCIARSKELDIAVDLGGYTEGARIGVFERRAAPIQVSYLGYLGTLGAPYIDYILADREVIPVEYQNSYAEKVIRLPNCYQINDRKRLISDRKITRAEFGLPEKDFVYCCFNHGYKITPEVFFSWCRILQRVDNSVLWLYESSKSIVKNFRAEAQLCGVIPERLIFSGTLPVSEYLARYRLADLFLDTYPYNAGTTANDALWSGLPVLTRSGKSFPSRMAGSILKAIGTPELVTQTIKEYENLAVELANNKESLRSLQKKIATNKMSMPLFDSPKTTKNIESAYLILYKRYLEGRNLENINLG